MSLEPDPGAVPDARAAVGMMIVRTALLVAALALMLPDLLGALTRGAWPRLVEGMGIWRWIAWGACFVLMLAARFSGGPKRGG